MKTKLGPNWSVLPILFMILLAGCSPETGTEILVGSETCKPPCWMDIQPGVTKSDDMVGVLQEHEKRGEGKLTLLDSGIARWRSTDDKNVYIYRSDNGLVSTIDLDLRPSSTHMNDIVALFGGPSKLDIGKIRDGYFFVTIFYPEKGLAFVGSSNEMVMSDADLGFVIQPDMVMVSGVFFQPSSITTMVNLLYGEEAVPDALSDIQDWTGYGIYRE